jgi:toluene monooxygenase system protein D
MAATNQKDGTLNNRVGPIMRAGEVAMAVVEAAEMDNPDKEIVVEDKVAYLRISAEQELLLTRESLEECLGRSFQMQEIEINLSSFAGQIEADSDHMRFYYNKSL